MLEPIKRFATALIDSVSAFKVQIRFDLLGPGDETYGTEVGGVFYVFADMVSSRPRGLRLVQCCIFRPECAEQLTSLGTGSARH